MNQLDFFSLQIHHKNLEDWTVFFAPLYELHLNTASGTLKCSKFRLVIIST